jgi:hypothetical protein
MDVNEIMLDNWVYVKEALGFPNLKDPTIVAGNDTACINMDTKEIFVFDEFINETNLDLNTFFKGVLAHEANHYVTVPYDLKTNMLLIYEASRASKTKGKDLANYFSDVVINLDLVKRDILEIADVYKDLKSTSIVDNTLKALYSCMTDLDFGEEGDIDNAVLNKLLLLDYNDLSLKGLRKNCYKFAKILSDTQTSSNEGVLFDRTQNTKILEDILDELSPEELKDFNSVFKSDLDIVDYYDSLSKKYSINIKSKKGSVVSNDKSVSDWDLDIPTSKIDYLKSKGKVIPTLTKYNSEIKGRTDIKTGLSDCFLLIDSSGSMQDPSILRSDAVLSSFIIANHYLDNNKEVAVTNFSYDTKVNYYSKNKQEIHNSIALFQDSTTKLNLANINKVLRKDSDVYLISDMSIDEFSIILDFFNKHESKVSFFHLCNEVGFEKKGKINYHKLNDASNLKSLILREVKNYD